MTLKNSYSSYFKNTLRRKSWNIALSSLVFFLTLPLPALMILGSNTDLNEFERTLIFKDVCGKLTGLMDFKGIFPKAALVLLAIIAGVSAFSYLHNKAKVDFYHSFPISRKAMFTCNFTASIIPVLIGYLINFIITILLIALFGYGKALMTPQIIITLAENILYFISTFSIVSLCTILCGNTIITLILTCVAFFGQPTIVPLIGALKYFLYPAYYFNPNMIIFNALNLSPATQMFNPFDYGTSNLRWISFAVYIIITAIIIAITMRCYLKRKSEHSGIAIAFNKFKLPLKIYCCIIFGLGFAVLFTKVVSNNVWIYFGIVFGILLAHALSEIAFDFNFKSMLKNWKHGVILIAVSCAIVVCMSFDITGFNKRTLKPSQIESFGFNVQSDTYSNMESFHKANLNGAENIKTMAEIMKIASTSNRKANVEKIHFELNVNKTSFGTFKRVYEIANTDENIALFNKIRYSKEYKKKISEIFIEDLKKSEKVTIDPAFPNSKKDFKVFKDSDTQNILRVMREDFLNLTSEKGFNQNPVFVASFDIPYNRTGNLYHGTKSFPIYKSYSNTLALLKELGYGELKPIDLDSIEKITIYKSVADRLSENIKYTKNEIHKSHTTRVYENEDNMITFTDKSDIEKLTKNSISSELFDTIDRFENRFTSTEIRVYFKGEAEFREFYTNDKDILDVVG